MRSPHVLLIALLPLPLCCHLACAQTPPRAEPPGNTTNSAPRPAPRRFNPPADVPAPRTDRNSQIAHEQSLEKAKQGGIDVYFPNLAKNTDGYWVELKRVELFPALPYCASVKETLVLHNAPSIYAKAAGKLVAGDQIVIREYLPQGSNVWGRTDAGWILLEYLSRGAPVYSSTWEMETRPPISFD